MIKLAIKDLKLFMADRRAFLLTFLLPIALISLFALAFGGIGTKGQDRPKRLVIADEDQSAESKKIIERLDATKEFEVAVLPLEEAENAVRKGDEGAILVLHKGVKDSVDAGNELPIEFKYDQAREAEVMILKGALYGQLMSITGPSAIKNKTLEKFDKDNPDMSADERARIHDQITKNFSSGGSVSFEPGMKETPMVAEEENSPGLVQAVAGTAIMMLLFSVAGMGASMLDEKQEGTLKKLLSSPLHPNSLLFGKMFSTYLISILQLMVMFLFAWIVFGLDILQNIPGLILMILATAFACSAFGVFLASFAKSRRQVQGISTLMILVMSAIGGSMIPLFVMPPWMQKIAVVSVNYWGIQGFYDIFWRSLPVSDPTFLLRLFILLAIGTGLNLISIPLFKKNVLSID